MGEAVRMAITVGEGLTPRSSGQKGDLDESMQPSSGGLELPLSPAQELQLFRNDQEVVEAQANWLIFRKWKVNSF